MSEENNNTFESKTKKTANEFKESWNQTTNNRGNKKILAGVLGIFFGHIGIHKFILGYNKEGFIQILLTIITCGIAGIVGFIEGIIYLTKSDEDFYNTYQVEKRSWF